jgi:hypothetical protein
MRVATHVTEAVNELVGLLLQRLLVESLSNL